MTISIQNKNSITLLKPDGELHFGCDQEFYPTKWKRMAGCGPTTASNLFLYGLPQKEGYRTQAEAVQVMNEIWEYVTPSWGGVRNTRMFTTGFNRYLTTKGIRYEVDVVDVPKKKHLRKPIQEVRDFIRNAIESNVPVAFLNLHNGEEKNLDAWHWVTVVGIEIDPNAQMYLDIFDAGKLISINLDRWYEKTIDGGGFVVYRLKA